ncbi:MAG TPA: alpha/beta hydrolase-fold protein [Gemmataceae bacterium]|nr:alpha/beta hydrolase-fold protein [Gemmataceae bacterium]
MSRITSAAIGLILFLPLPPCWANPLWNRDDLDEINHKIQGQVIDHTDNHGADRRIWSSALHEKRALYVYLPPSFNPHERYPVMFWLHGFAQDERSFLRYVVNDLDAAMVAGRLPAMIVVAPDGSLTRNPFRISAGSFFLNTRAGAFEDFVMVDVWKFVLENYPIRPEREAHVLAGVSMGGGSAYNLAMKHRDRFKVVLGIFPPLNNRWLDCHCRYLVPFDPACWGWRTDFSNPYEVVGRFYGILTIRLKDVMDSLYTGGPETVAQVSWDNPIEMIDRLCLQEGELCMYVAYGGRDEFNITAQVESFLFRARQRGLSITVAYDPRGKHDFASAQKFWPSVMEWLYPLVAPFSPRESPQETR